MPMWGDPNVFCAEDHLPVPLQVRSKRFCAEDRGFLSERTFQESTLASLAVVLRTCTGRHVYWHCGITPGLVSWHEFVCMARSVRVSSVRRLVSVMLWLRCSRFFLVGFRFCPAVCCDGFAIRCCLLCFVGVGPVSRDACMNWARVYLRNAPVHALGPGFGQAEA